MLLDYRKNMFKILTFFIILVSLSVSMTACNSSSNINKTDVITQKEVSSGRTPITVLVKYAFSINGFEKAVEEKFPDIDIIQVGNYTDEMGIKEYESRLKNDDLTDIVMTWPLEVGEEYWEDRLLDLSGMEFSSRYNLSMLNNISKDGKLYYLPGPSQIRGIVYNKTLFEEKGWQVPTDFNGFVELCKTIEASGIRSLQLGFGNAEVLDTAFVGYNYSKYFSRPKDISWLDNYNNGIGSFGDHFGSALDVFQLMIDEGIWKKSDLDVRYSDRTKMLFTRQCAMVEDSALMTRIGYEQTGTTDEFALMPFFNPENEGDWARLYMVCYVGLNKHLADTENKTKYDLVMKIMDYISSSEGQSALASDTGGMYSNLIGEAPPDIPEIQDLIPTLNAGRYAIFPTLKNAQGALRKGLSGMLSGDLTKDDVIKMVDNQNLTPPVVEQPLTKGTATSDFTMVETGCFITDAMREYSGCEIALFLDNGKDGKYNGKGVSARLYEGAVTTDDISRILPALQHGETGKLWKITMSGSDLIKTLEYAIPVDNNITGWFYYFSGLKMKYNPMEPPGKRIQKITTQDGKKIDSDKLYSIAVMDETVPEEFIQSCEKTDVLISSVLEKAIVKAGSISPAKDGRFNFK